MKSKVFFAIAALAALTLSATPTTAFAELASGYTSETYSTVMPQGQFTAHNGQVHYWGNGYQVYDVATSTTTSNGTPPNGTTSNGYGDPFGVFDAKNHLFYAAASPPGRRNRRSGSTRCSRQSACR